MKNGKLKMDIKMKHSIKEIVKGTTANLAYSQSGKLYYTVMVANSEDNVAGTEYTLYTFPVDVTDRDDVGDSRFELTHKAITLMRYIRKAIKSEEIRWV